ncbi:VOC family protein [Phycicoccus ginsengisoli]
MTVKRIKPNILASDFEASRRFYNDVIGLDGGHGLDWILFFGADKREVQLSVMALDIKAHQHPDVSIEVDDVDDVYERAVDAGAQITYLPAHRRGLGATTVLRARPQRRDHQRHPARRIAVHAASTLTRAKCATSPAGELDAGMTTPREPRRPAAQRR